jgi:hypothetical protein
VKRFALLLFCSAAVCLRAQEPATLKLTSTIALPGVKGRIDHFDIDTKGHRRERIPKRPGARTSFFSAELDKFYLAAPARENEPAEIRIFQPRK